MADKPAFLTDTAGTLTFPVPEGTPAGSPTPTVTLYDPSDTELHASQNATISGTNLTVALTTSDTDDVDKNYRARWSYTVGTTAYVRDQVFDVTNHVLYNTLTATEAATYYPDIVNKLENGSTDLAVYMGFAWNDDVLPSIRARGMNPHLIMDAQQLEPVTGAFTIARAIDGMAGSNEKWRATAKEWREKAVAELDRVLAAVSWYDENDDLAAEEEEEAKPMASIRLTR